ncbi:MAG: hypothetical protein WC372_10660 [Candidatus Neomarinimicrobiota bacterium]|jgi:hypothetical protein
MKTTDATVLQTTDIAATRTTAEKPAAARQGKQAPDVERKPWEQWGRKKPVSAAALRSAAILRHWAIGRFVTEAEFDAAVEAASNLSFR